MTQPCRRVLVIGISGGGKSTFSRRLAAAAGLPIIHLDKEFWQPGWRMPPPDQWRATVARLVAGESWIMDGTFGSTLDLRLPRADHVVWIDRRRSLCLYRAVRRSIATYGRVRADLAPGCPEQFDLAFYRYIWTFDRTQRPIIENALATHGTHLAPVMIRRDGDAARFLASVAGSAAAT